MKKIIYRIEDKTIGLWEFIMGVLVIATLRDLIEVIQKTGFIYSNHANPFADFKVFFLHFNSFFFLTFLALSLSLYLFTHNHNNVSNCFKVGLFAMPLILFPPIFDALIGNREWMRYPGNPVSVIKDLQHFFNPFYNLHDIQIGQRYAATIATLLAGWYIHLKTHKIWKSVVGGICFLSVIFVLGFTVPTLCQLYENGLHFKNDFSPHTSLLLQTGQVLGNTAQKIAALYLLLIICLSAITFYIYHKEKCKAIIANFRFTRTVHYLVLFFAGFLFALFLPAQYDINAEYVKTFISRNPFEYIGVSVAALSVFFSFQSAVIFNDIYDFDIDKISKLKRPLVSKVVDITEYKNLAKLFLFLAFLLSLCVNEAFFLMILACNGLAYLYSNPPFRLRKYFIISNAILAVIAMVTFYAGATVLATEYSFQIIPAKVSLVLLAGFFLSITIKDIKDVEGDRRHNVKSLMTVFGNKWGLIITAVIITTTIIMIPFMLQINGMQLLSVIIAVLFNLALFFVKYKKETLIFVLYYLYLVVLFYLLVFKQHGY